MAQWGAQPFWLGTGELFGGKSGLDHTTQGQGGGAISKSLFLVVLTYLILTSYTSLWYDPTLTIFYHLYP